MASPMAFGDSRTYFRTRQHLQPIENQQVSPYWPGAYTNVANGYAQMQIASEVYQNALRDAKAEPKELASPDRVITDMGFGGAEAKPRSRRYRKAKSA